MSKKRVMLKTLSLQVSDDVSKRNDLYCLLHIVIAYHPRVTHQLLPCFPSQPIGGNYGSHDYWASWGKIQVLVQNITKTATLTKVPYPNSLTFYSQPTGLVVLLVF